MLRVLHVVTDMNRGGLETMIMNYYRNIDRKKIQFDFLVHRGYRASYDDEIESYGGKIYRLSRLIPWSKNYIKMLDAFFQDHPEYKIVHVHQDCLSGVILKVAEKNGVPIRIAHSHSSSQDKNLKYLIKLWYKRWIPKYATDLFACGKEAGDWMFGGAKYKIINNAISAKVYTFDAGKRDVMRKELNLGNAFTLGLTARFSWAKNHHFLLDIFDEVLKMDPSAKLLLVGDGELRKDIEAKMHELGLAEHVIMTGVRSDVQNLLQAMDVFVMPSNYEGLGVAAVEAQAAGLPCFLSDKVPEACKITDSVYYIALSESARTWASQILSVKGKERKNTYQEIKNSGYDIEQNAKQLENFYIKKYENLGERN